MRIVAVGDNCIDNYIVEKKIYAGGNALNVAIYLRELGIKSSFVSVVGNDDNGNFIIQEVKRKNVDISNLIVTKGKTAETIIKLVNNDRVFDSYDSGVMEEFVLTDKMIKFIENHDLVHTSIDSKILNTIESFKNIKISCDFSDELDNKIVKKIASKLDFAFFSYTENNEFIKEYMREIHNIGTKLVIVSLGSMGSICFDGEKFYEEGIIDVDVIDTLGAGDSFIAGFIIGILSGKSISNSLKMGTIKASETIQHFGAW